MANIGVSGQDDESGDIAFFTFIQAFRQILGAAMPADAGNEHQLATFDPVLERAVFRDIGPAYRVIPGGLPAPEPNGVQAGQKWHLPASQCHSDCSHYLCFALTDSFADNQDEAIAQGRDQDTHNGCNPGGSIGGC